MAAQQIELTDRHRAIIKQAVDSGAFRDESEVVGEALRRFEYQQEQDRIKLDRLRMLLQQSMDQYSRGEYITLSSDEDIDAFMDEIDRKTSATCHAVGISKEFMQ
jgi:antitoxin ParD1/3/4